MRTGDSAIDARQCPLDAALWLARAFAAGSRLAVAAPGLQDHAHHIAVEFIHPVVTGTQALPASVVRDLESVADARTACIFVGRREAAAGADVVISAEGPEAEIVRAYHLLWELVQVALEHPGLVGASAVAGGDSTGFLYPFLDAAETDPEALIEALASSAEAKTAESERIVAQALADNAAALDAAAAAVADAVSRGGRVHAMGNGGSATDAARLARLLGLLGIEAAALTDDYAVLTALANDIGVDAVFARQVEALAAPGDLLVGYSTSGASPNLLRAFEAAHSGEVTTVGFSGRHGSHFASAPAVQHCLTVDASSIHRIQEAQAALSDALCAALAQRLGLPSRPQAPHASRAGDENAGARR